MKLGPTRRRRSRRQAPPCGRGDPLERSSPEPPVLRSAGKASQHAGVRGPPNQRSPLQQRSTPRTYLIPLSLLLKRFDVVWNGNPTPRTLHPDEEFWPEPASVIKRAGFDGSYVRCGLQNVIDADSTFWAEHTRNLVAAVGRTRELLCRANDSQAVFLDRHGHAEGACRLALAFFAVAREDADRFHRYDVTH